MKYIRLTLTLIAAAVGALVASAQQAPVEAVISSFTGTVTVTTPGATVAVPAVVGQKLPEGSTVSTGKGANVLIQSHEGITTGLVEKTTAVVGTHSVNADGVRTAVIDLKTGTTVSVLDPSNRKINNYGVRTPKGVAAARGTTYSTAVTLDSGGQVVVTVNTLTGAVHFSIVDGRSVNISEGKSANSSSGVATSIATAIASASTPEEKAQLTEALKVTVSVVATIAEASKATGDNKAADTLKTVIKNTEDVADEVSKSDKVLGDTIKADSKAAQEVEKPVVINEAKASDNTQKNDAPVTIKTSTRDITIVSPSQ